MRFLVCFCLVWSLAVLAQGEGEWSDAAYLNSNGSSDSGADENPEVLCDGDTWIAVWESGDTLGGTIGDDLDILVALSSDGIQWSAPMSISEGVGDTGGDFDPRIATDGQGTWVVVWATGSNPPDIDLMFSRSIDDGANWSEPAFLNTDVGVESNNQFEPDVDTDGAGNWIAVWQSFDGENDIFFSASADNAASWTAPAVLNNNAAMDTGNDQQPRIAYDGQGNWVVAWNSTDDLGGTIGGDNDIVFARSTNTGVTWTDPAPLYAYAAEDQGLVDWEHSIAADGAANLVVAWSSSFDLPGGGDTRFDVHTVTSNDGGTNWSAPVQLTETLPSDEFNTDVVGDGNGSWLTVFYSIDTLGGTVGTDGDIFGCFSSDNGANWSSPFLINSTAQVDTVFDFSPGAATDGQGRWLTAWYSATEVGRGDLDQDILFSYAPGLCQLSNTFFTTLAGWPGNSVLDLIGIVNTECPPET